MEEGRTDRAKTVLSQPVPAPVSKNDMSYQVRKPVASAAMKGLLLRNAESSGLGHWMRTWSSVMNRYTSHKVEEE